MKEQNETINIVEKNDQFEINRVITETIDADKFSGIVSEIRNALHDLEVKISNSKKAVEDFKKKVSDYSLNEKDVEFSTIMSRVNSYNEAKKGLDTQEKNLADMLSSMEILKDRLKVFASKSLKAEELKKKNERKSDKK